MSAVPEVFSENVLRERVALLCLAVLVFLPYFLINHVTSQWAAHDLSTAVDGWVPFQPVWELVYVSIYFYIFVPVVYVRDLALFRRAVLAFCLMQLFSFACFLSVPATIERPTLGDIDSQFLHWGLALNWTLDQPRNLFPSLHLANAFMVSLLLYRLDRKVGVPAIVWACLIGYSTLAAGHHLFVDVVAGIILALVVDRLLLAPFISQGVPANALYPRRYMGRLIAVYPLTLLLLYGLWRWGWRPFFWPPVMAG